MATMIPPQFNEDTKSAAEKKLFVKFRDMRDTDGWVIIHSLMIAKHETQSQGETDFLAIIPNQGVFALEVKGGRISYHDGSFWTMNRDDVSSKVHPVEQANDGMHSIIKYLKGCTGNTNSLEKCILGYGVAFPDSDVKGQIELIDVDDCQIADLSNLDDMRSYFLELAKFWKECQKENIRKGSVRVPNESDCREIVKLLRPNINSHVSLTRQIVSLENQILKLTEEQEVVFSGLFDNPRCIVSGAAGTGKTILAMNFARQKAKEGYRVGFFCYNIPLAAYLREKVVDDSRIVCDSFTDYMEKRVMDMKKDEAAKVKAENTNFFYDQYLPQTFADLALENEIPKFDFLVVDEAQDLMTEAIFDAMDVILDNGMKDGSWYVFLDADHQNLYRSSNEIEKVYRKMIDEFRACRFRLRRNCRNSLSIIKKINEFFGSEYSMIHVDEVGPEVNIKRYTKSTNQVTELAEILKTLVNEGVKKEDITILSSKRLINSVASEITEYEFSTNERKTNAIFFSTIKRFKGLESPVIILTDLGDMSVQENRKLLYIGMTRAKSVLYILMALDDWRYIDIHRGEL